MSGSRKTSGNKIETIMEKIGNFGTLFIKKNKDLRKNLPKDISDKGAEETSLGTEGK